jgi:integrase
MQTEKPLEHIEPTALFDTPRTWEETKALQVATTKLYQEHAASRARNKYVALYGEPDEDVPPKWFVDQTAGPNPTTADNYESRGAHAFSFASATGEDVWDKLAERAGSLAAWYTGRAALQFFLLKTMRKAKGVIDCMHEPGSDKKKFNEALELLPRLANALLSFPKGRPAKFEKGSGFKPVRRSKSRSLHKVPSDWRERVAEAMPERHRLFWLLQCATGCRPQELARGISVQLRPLGLITMTIAGAKLSKRAGQPHRTILLSIKEVGVVQMLARELVARPDVVLVLPCKVDTYRKAVSRCCRKVFPTADVNKLLSAYSARHQRKADWKVAGMNRIDLAKSLGHRTTRSSTYYGANVRGRTGSVKPVAVAATHEVKVRQTFTPASGSTANVRPGSKSGPRMRPRPK